MPRLPKSLRRFFARQRRLAQAYHHSEQFRADQDYKLILDTQNTLRKHKRTRVLQRSAQQIAGKPERKQDASDLKKWGRGFDKWGWVKRERAVKVTKVTETK